MEQHRLQRGPDRAPGRHPSGYTAGRPPTTPTGPTAATSSASRRASRTYAGGGWEPARWSTSPAPRLSAGGASRSSGCCASGSRGSRSTTVTGSTSTTMRCSPTVARVPRRRGTSAPCTGCRCSARWTRSIPARACCSAAAAGPASRPSASTWGGDQPSDFWSLRVLLVATLSAAASGISNWSHDLGGYLGHRLIERCRPELLVRWLQFGCFTPLMHAHAKMPQEPWNYGERTMALYRAYVLLHEQLMPVRASGCGDRGPHRAADHPTAVPDRSVGSARVDADRLPTATGRRCGSRRCSTTAHASARWRCRVASGSRPGRATGSPAAVRSGPGAAEPHAGVGPGRLDRRHLPGRPRCARARGRTRALAAVDRDAVG